MSIQSEIDRIKSEVNSQASLISQIRTAIQGKTGGSGGVETCTVTVVPIDEDAWITSYSATQYSNGTFISKDEDVDVPQITIENVVKGSVFVVSCDYTPYGVEITNATRLRSSGNTGGSLWLVLTATG